MERFAAYVNDPPQAQQALSSLLVPGAGPAHCVMVLCPPRLPRHIGRWLSPAHRALWRVGWAHDLRERLTPALSGLAPGVCFEWVVAQGSLPELTRQLRQRHGASLRVLDLRRPRLGTAAEPIEAGPGRRAAGRLAAPLAVSSTLSLVLALTD